MGLHGDMMALGTKHVDFIWFYHELYDVWWRFHWDFMGFKHQKYGLNVLFFLMGNNCVSMDLIKGDLTINNILHGT